MSLLLFGAVFIVVNVIVIPYCCHFLGAEIIESERRRLYELKERASQQVRSQWEQQQRDKQCNSVGSESTESTSSSSIVTGNTEKGTR